MSKKNETKSVANNETTSMRRTAMRKNTTYVSVVIDTLRDMGINRLNRDELGRPKTVPFKDKSYRELSSQFLKYCLKYDTDLFLKTANLNEIWELCNARNQKRKSGGQFTEDDVRDGYKAFVLTFKQINALLSKKSSDDSVLCDCEDDTNDVSEEAENEDLQSESEKGQTSELLSVDELCFLMNEGFTVSSKPSDGLKNLKSALEFCPYLPPVLAFLTGRMVAGSSTLSIDSTMTVPNAVSVNPVEIITDSFICNSSANDLQGASARGKQWFVTSCLMHETYMIDLTSLLRNIDNWNKRKEIQLMKKLASLNDSLAKRKQELEKMTSAGNSKKNTKQNADETTEENGVKKNKKEDTPDKAKKDIKQNETKVKKVTSYIEMFESAKKSHNPWISEITELVAEIVKSACRMPSMKNSTYRGKLGAEYTHIAIGNAQLSTNHELRVYCDRQEELVDESVKTLRATIDREILEQKNQADWDDVEEPTVKQYEIKNGFMFRCGETDEIIRKTDFMKDLEEVLNTLR